MLKKYTLIAFGFILFFSSCSLDPEVDNTYDEEFAFFLPDRVEGFLINAYANLPNTIVDGYGGNFLDAATDNAVTNDFDSAIYRLSQGGLTANSNPVGNWTNAYAQFRNIHIFFENEPNAIFDLESEESDRNKRRNLRGEAFYLRAWWGFQLLQAYGGKTDDGQALGYPIVLKSLVEGEASDLESVKRNTYAECVAQIQKDLDSSIALLPVQYQGGDPITGINQLGRADQRAAYALKSRVSMYGASPAYQPDNITTISAGSQMFNFQVVDQTAYTNKWVVAANDAQNAIDLIGNLPGLSEGNFTDNNTPDEFIWRSYHNNRNLENFNYPIGEFGQARTGPSQNLVDAFYGANGFPITDARSNYDPENPYENRDPRLTLNVLYNGQVLDADPLQIYQGGEDSNSVYAQNTRTGYYLRKWLSLAEGILGTNPSNDNHYNPYLRCTELWLNFAEASNEAYGPDVVGPGLSLSASDAIKRVRTRSGISNQVYVNEVAAQGKEAFRTLIQRERRLELAFENQRYFDMRRWLMPLNEPVYGYEITREENGDLNYEEIVVEERPFNDIKYYYAPLPYDELVKSPNLINNLGW